MDGYALVVGISDYDRLPKLPKPATDAEAVAQRLQQYGDFQIKRSPSRWNAARNEYEIAPKRLTGKDLSNALKQFLQEQAVHKKALIYFSGHGFIEFDNADVCRGYLAASDCEVEVDSQRRVIGQKNGFSLDSFNRIIADSNLSSLVVILDCCNAGYFLEQSLVRQTLTAFSVQRDYYLITACRSFEKAYQADENSVLTGAVLKGLSQENASSDGSISGDRLFDAINTDLRHSRQEPLRLGWGRSIQIVTYPVTSTSTLTTPGFRHDNPYIGLTAFDAGKKEYFYGREQAARALLDRLTNARFLAVMGPSGCGKSSLVKAGLLPQLTSDHIPGSSQWKIVSIAPGSQPLNTLLDALSQQPPSQPLVLFIDQFEELFTLCQEEAEQRQFIRLMSEQVTQSDRLIRVIVAIRGDFLDRCATIPESATLINRNNELTTYMVTSMSFAELEKAIAQPAAQHGVRFEPGLVTEIAAAVENQPGALPLLQYGLTELWKTCIREDSTQPLLTRQSYTEIGGIQGALQRRADLLYQSFSADDQAFFWRLMGELVKLGDDDDQKATRRLASWRRLRAIALADQLQRIVGQLTHERLLVADESTVEVAHEALLSEWALLKTWIDNNRDNIRLSHRLTDDCQEWLTQAKANDYLLGGGRLAAIEEWVEKYQPLLPDEEAAFLKQSVEKRDRELQTQLDQERRLREAAEARARESGARVKAEKQRTRIAIGAGCLLTVLVALAGAFKLQAKQQESVAVGALVSEAQQLSKSKDGLTALVASVRALKQMQAIGMKDQEITGQLREVIYGVRERNRLEGHTKSVNGVSYSPENRLIVSGGSDKFIKLWRIDGAAVNTIKPMKHEDEVYSVNFSPTGEFIASGSADGVIKLWSRDGVLLASRKGHGRDINYLSFSPDGKTVASASSDRSVKLWNVRSTIPKGYLGWSKTLKGHTNKVRSTTFSPDGSFIASASDDEIIKIWKRDGSLYGSLVGHKGSVSYASFGADNHTLVSVSGDKTIRLWNWRLSPKSVQDVTVKTLTDRANKSYIVRYSPNYKVLASSSADGSVQLWNTTDYRSIDPIGRHSDVVYDLSFSDDTESIFTASRDNTVRVWRLSTSSTAEASKASQEALIKYSCEWLTDYLRTNAYAIKNYQDVKDFCSTINKRSD